MKKISPIQKPLEFDAIIVYTGRTALSAGDKTYTGRTPFAKHSSSFGYNKSYAYFLQHCKAQGLRAAFTTTNDISGPGLFSAVWIFEKTWKRKKQSAHTRLIFDKFSGLAAHNIKPTALLTSTPKEDKVHFFHDQKIREIFNNKLKTFTAFSEYAIPTVKIDLLSEKHITAAKKSLGLQLKNHKYRGDFPETFVVKDQFGCGGTNVFKVKENKKLFSIGKKSGLISFILQPFIESSGFHFGKYVGNIDLRIIICNGVIVQSYIRIPKKGDFRANAQQGGEVVYLTHKMIPPDVIKMTAAINKKLPLQNSFYSLDFIKSSTGHLYFIEGDVTPGLNWFDEEDERHAKQLMRLIIKNLKTMVPSSVA